MPAYKYTLKDGKTIRWRVKFCTTDWTGAKRQVCKRGFKTQREAKEFERLYPDQQSNTSDILFSSLVENYLEDMSHRLKPTTMENKRFIILNSVCPGSPKRSRNLPVAPKTVLSPLPIYRFSIKINYGLILTQYFVSYQLRYTIYSISFCYFFHPKKKFYYFL